MDTLRDAQAAFNEHAAEHHEIVLERIDEPAETEVSAPEEGAGASERELHELDTDGCESG